MKIILAFITAMLVLTGCATNPDYALYVKAQADIDISKYTAKAAKYKALADIAVAGGEGAKSSATMAMALDDRDGSGQLAQLQAPQASGALQWASILVPGLTQIAGIAANVKLGTVQSNNATALGISTNGTFAGIAGKIQAAPTITTTNTDRHDVYTPAPVIVNTPTPLVPVVVNPPTVITPVVQIVPVITPTP